MSVNGQDVIETKLSREDPTLVTGVAHATRVQAVARAGHRGRRRRAERDPQGGNLSLMVVAMLGLVAIIATLGGVVIAMVGRQVPEMVVALGSAAAGALAGLLVPSPAGRR
jgi:hypothetical protein